MLNHFTTVFMLLNLGLLVWVGYMLFWPVQLAEIYNEPFPVYPQVVERGDTLMYEIEFNKTKQYRVAANKNIICEDGNLVTLAPTESDAPLGKHKAVGSIVIPEKASSGDCYLQFDNTYYVNALRSVHREMRTQSFIIKD